MLKLLPPRDDSTLEELRAVLPTVRDYIDTRIRRPDHFLGHVGKLACIAYSHLDVAYHWTTKQTIQKNARTCLLQLRLMEDYPDYRYAHSQAWSYEMLERHYPKLFERVRQRTAEGRWEIAGGMYVEPDCNLPCAEGLIRQVTYGKLYFLEKFGVDVDSCWLPDNFGNSAVLPQILRLGGIRYFMSSKLAVWYDTNKFPYSLFSWRGLDGSDVNACIPPMHFITWFNADQMTNNWNGFEQKAICGESAHL
jgi:alpha-mannosidase